MKTITWGIIGCGDVAEVKSEPAFQKCENSNLLAVMRRDGAKAKDFAQRHNVPLFFDEADAIINHEEINAVYIATPPSTHLKYALDVLNANKDVYLEKPMTLNADEARQLVSALKSSKSKLTIAHYRRQLPAFLKIKALLDSNAIGNVLFTDLQILQTKQSNIIADTEDEWRLDPNISGGGYFHDLAPHQLDLMLLWFGKTQSAAGFISKETKKAQVASTVNGIINFNSGVQFSGVWCFNVSKAAQKDTTVVYGTDGKITFSFYGDTLVLEANGKTDTFKFDNPKHVQQPLIQETINYFLGKADNPCTVEEGLEVMQVMDGFTS